jgi:hypothetical protein
MTIQKSRRRIGAHGDVILRSPREARASKDAVMRRCPSTSALLIKYP